MRITIDIDSPATAPGAAVTTSAPASEAIPGGSAPADLDAAAFAASANPPYLEGTSAGPPSPELVAAVEAAAATGMRSPASGTGDMEGGAAPPLE